MGVEVLGFLVLILVDAHLAGVYSCVVFAGAVVRIDVSWGEGLDLNEGSLGARGGLIGGVNFFGNDFGNDALEHVEHSARASSSRERPQEILEKSPLQVRGEFFHFKKLTARGTQ